MNLFLLDPKILSAIPLSASIAISIKFWSPVGISSAFANFFPTTIPKIKIMRVIIQDEIAVVVIHTSLPKNWKGSLYTPLIINDSANSFPAKNNPIFNS